jgi:hypothetical protein
MQSGQSQATPSPFPQSRMHAVRGEEPSSGAGAAMLRVAERELYDALVAQRRPTVGMHFEPSADGRASFDRAVMIVTIEAHRLDLRAEEMLVAIKQAWAHLAEARAHHLGDRDGDVLREVVTSSIKEFFAKRENSGTAD